MRKILPILLLFTIMLAMPIYADDKDFHEIYAGIQFDFPYYWDRVEGSSQSIYFYPSYIYETDGNKTGMITFYKTDLYVPEEKEELFLYQYKKGSENSFTINNINRFTLLNSPAERISFTQTIDGDVFNGEQIIVINNETAFSLTYVQREGTDIKIKDDFDAVISTAKYLSGSENETNSPNLEDNNIDITEETSNPEEITSESIIDSICEYSGINLELPEHWEPAAEVGKTDNFYVALLLNSQNSDIITVYIGKHESDIDGSYDSTLGFSTKEEREKGEEITVTDWPINDHSGKMFYYYDTENNFAASLSVNLTNSLIEFVYKCPKNELSEEKIDHIVDIYSSFVSSLILADLKSE